MQPRPSAKRAGLLGPAAITAAFLGVTQVGNWIAVPGIEFSAVLHVLGCRSSRILGLMDGYACPPDGPALDSLSSPAIVVIILGIVLAVTVARRLTRRQRT